jgi:hypothetical protein
MYFIGFSNIELLLNEHINKLVLKGFILFKGSFVFSFLKLDSYKLIDRMDGT